LIYPVYLATPNECSDISVAIKVHMVGGVDMQCRGLGVVGVHDVACCDGRMLWMVARRFGTTDGKGDVGYWLRGMLLWGKMICW
jgi:hypothetical protein